MTESELTALAALANAATPGPWHGEHGELLHTTLAPTKRHPDRAYTNALAWVEETDHASGEYLVRLMDTDAAYIAAMHPGTTLGLIAEVRRLRALVESAYLEGAADGYGEPCLGWWESAKSRKALDRP